MQCKSYLVVLLLGLMLAGISTYGQGSLGPTPKRARTPEDYQPRTLKEIATKGSDTESSADKEDTVIVRSDILPSRVRVRYIGSVRPLPQIKKDVLVQWARLYAGFPEGFTAPYETEMLFTEAGAKYWLAVRKKLVPQVRKELKKGEAVDLYLIRLGGVKTAGEWEWVFLVESFQKPK